VPGFVGEDIMDFLSRKERGGTVVTLVGRLDTVTAPDYERQVQELLASGETRLVLDLERLDYISSAGLRGLLLTAKLLRARDGQLRFVNVTERVRSVFHMSGLAGMFPIEESLATALAAPS
jgi:stage II sporulation protein AA (anti-sigma F factor antagonist)